VNREFLLSSFRGRGQITRQKDRHGEEHGDWHLLCEWQLLRLAECMSPCSSAGLINGTTLPKDVYEYEFGRENQILRCPWHGWEFDLINGHHLAPDSNAKLRGFEVKVEDGQLYVMMT
jgi:hypothetical protein